MTSIIFIHGTGVRKESYAVTFEHIEKTLKELKPEIELFPCLWGDDFGTQLQAKGASIPNYNLSGGGSNIEKQQDYLIELWEKLYQDSLYEIRLLSLKPLGTQIGDPGEQLEERVEQLITSSELQKELKEVGIEEVFNKAYQKITGEESELVYERLLERASEPLDEYYIAIARAIVAEIIRLHKQDEIYSRILFDPKLRDQIVALIVKELSKDTVSKGLGDFVKNWLVANIKNVGDKKLQRKRGALTDNIFPFIGDIILYQAKGELIRNCIQKQIENIETPVVLLAHSLGGIACVDLLVQKNISKVELLITVGSQSPFFYEIGALQSLSYPKPLPEYFPEWLNIYDLRDVLSYVGDHEDLFFGRIQDVRVDNKQPFPESHGAYWYNQETWDAIMKKLSR